MEKVYVECAAAYILQRPAESGLLCEQVLVFHEKYENEYYAYYTAQ